MHMTHHQFIICFITENYVQISESRENIFK